MDILHAIISKSKHCWWRDNNYTKKLVTQRLVKSCITFLIFRGLWHVAGYYTWSLNINESIVATIDNKLIWFYFI